MQQPRLQFRGRLHRALLAQVREPEVRVIPFLSERHVIVRRTRTKQIVAVVVERVQNGRRVVVVQRVRVTVVVILSAERRSSQRVDVGVSVSSHYARSARCSSSLGAYRTLLTWTDDKRVRKTLSFYPRGSSYRAEINGVLKGYISTAENHFSVEQNFPEFSKVFTIGNRQN